MSNYWLMKTEPTTYSIADLEREKKTQWEGVRNYQARNFMMKDMEIGDQVLFYHSNATPPGGVGLAEVCSESYPDYFAWDESSKYFDPKSPESKPRWFMVDVAYKKTFKSIISLSDLRAVPDLESMMVLQKGSRLSIQPVRKEHYDIIVGMSL